MKQCKGITLMTLVITIIVMLIIAGAVISVGIGNLKTKNLVSMYTDLKSLNDKIAVYYNRYGTLPLGERFMGAYDFKVVANPNDDEDGYYVVNVNRLDKLVLVNKLTWEENDVYIINTKTHTLYYPEGVELDGEMYYRLPGEYSKLDISSNEKIQISASPIGRMTAEDVTVTIVWPEVGDNIVKQIKIGNEDWQTVAGDTNKVVVTKNTTVVARMTDTDGDVSTAKITVNNIDKNAPIVTATAGTEIMEEGTSNQISKYFTVNQNGIADIESIVYIDTSNGNVEVSNTNALEVGTHTIQCIAAKETGSVASATKTIIIEPEKFVFGNLYKISDTEYHLIFNTDGDIAEGYTESQLVARGNNIKDGAGRIEIAEGVYKSNQPWADYSENIVKVKIEETLNPTSTAHYFRGLTAITEIEGIEKLDTNNVINMWCMFMNCSSLTNVDVSGFNTENVKNMESIFNGCSNLTSVDLIGWDTKNVTTMYKMFYKCSALKSLELSGFDTKKVESMEQMFDGCNSLIGLDLSGFDTSKVTNMYCMFSNCYSLTNLDVSNFNTSNVTNMQSMFGVCEGLTDLDVSRFDTSKVTDMKSMFYKCSGLTSLDVSGFDTSNVIIMYTMFSKCNSLTSLDVSGFDTSNVTDMTSMFYDCENLTTIYVGEKWTTSTVTESTNMFYKSTKLSGAILYDSTKTDATYANYTTGYLTYKASQ